jgi:hypothetical protein
MSVETINSLESQLKTVVDICSRLVVSSPSSAYGSDSMGELVADQTKHFQVLIEGLRRGVSLRDETFQRALTKTCSEQARLQREFESLERRVAAYTAERRGKSTVSELVELRDKLKAQMAELDSIKFS